MFTFKAVCWARQSTEGPAAPTHPGSDYSVFTGQRYHVNSYDAPGVLAGAPPPGGANGSSNSFRQVLILGGPEQEELRIGHEQTFAKVFVMNEHGKTVDTIC